MPVVEGITNVSAIVVLGSGEGILGTKLDPAVVVVPELDPILGVFTHHHSVCQDWAVSPLWQVSAASHVRRSGGGEPNTRSRRSDEQSLLQTLEGSPYTQSSVGPHVAESREASMKVVAKATVGIAILASVILAPVQHSGRRRQAPPPAAPSTCI